VEPIPRLELASQTSDRSGENLLEAEVSALLVDIKKKKLVGNSRIQIRSGKPERVFIHLVREKRCWNPLKFKGHQVLNCQEDP
jgi:hypothetical protein